MRETQVEQTLCSLNLLFDGILIEVFNVIIDELNADFSIINLSCLCFL